MSEYTGRQIAILTDSHGLLEPTEAALKSMAKRGISEIYSLGDNIGDGPNPLEVLELLRQYNVKSIAGNAEEYQILGIEPFSSYFTDKKKRNYLWTKLRLTEKEMGQILLFPHFFELSLGNKKIALCHFANDVRFDYDSNSTWSYQRNFDYDDSGERYSKNASNQFRYTNSEEQKKKIDVQILKMGENSLYARGLVSAKNEPLFGGKTVDEYDAIIQGHVHWKLTDVGENGKPTFYTVRAVGMAYRKDPVNTASYIILKEHDKGFDIEEVLVEYDRDKMVYNILSCDNPYSPIKMFTCISKEEEKKFGKGIFFT